MKVKLDENVTTAAAALLRDHGHDVDMVPAEGLTGATDATLIEACQAAERMLVTFDVGFGDVRAYPPRSQPGIVLLRITDQRPDSTVDVLRRFLANHALDDLRNALVVVSDDRVRIRRTDPQDRLEGRCRGSGWSDTRDVVQTYENVLYVAFSAMRALIERVASKSARGSDRLLLTMREVAERLAVGRSIVYELAARGELEVVHIGRCARVPVDALDTFVDRRRASAVTKR